MESSDQDSIAILGGGNIGVAMAKGFVNSGRFSPSNIIITRHKVYLLEKIAKQGFVIQTDNCDAVRRSKIIIIAVPPQQINNLIKSISHEINPEKHIIMSVVSGVSTDEIINLLGKKPPVVRVMPTIAVAIQESMTCIASENASKEILDMTKTIFDSVGKTILIKEEQMVPATALCACGIAFFLRAIRAASQGGIEIGFHSNESLLMAAQTAKGAASLLLSSENHPEMEIDKVTTPEGCTISGLNEMEHQGFSSAMIRGIVTSSEKASKLYKKDND
jgi:pyrroline-5-carboxylate reductase